MAVTDMIASRASNRGFSLVELLVVLAAGATLMAIGTPMLRGALVAQRLEAGAFELANAMSEARRHAVRASITTRVELDPADGRISMYSANTNTNVEVERIRTFLPQGVVFKTLGIITNYQFDSLGRPASLPMAVELRSTDSNDLLTVAVLGSGRINIQ